ncbi:hypothetical protein LCGC14_1045980 [marine sediment metagenome]|uniref:ATP-dependent Clp protease proteolytic subunit n=1 Tax=marine sediment metagenome TaxID=412755 RepID=A0A0F9QWG0_9ZZZZ
MPRYNKEEIDRYFDYGIFVKARILSLESLSCDNGEGESGTDYQMFSNFIKGLTFLARLSEDPITIQMNNLGGDWFHGMAIYDAIRACRCQITIIAYGYCCSMGSVIFQAADIRIIAPDCILLIHDGSEGFIGATKSFESWADYSKVTRKRMYEIYLARIKTKKPKSKWTLEKVEKLCAHDKIYSATQAVDIGLADCCLELFETNHKREG